MNELLTTRQVAEICQVGPATIRAWIANGLLPAVTLPHKNNHVRWRVRRDTLDTMIRDTFKHTSNH